MKENVAWILIAAVAVFVFAHLIAGAYGA